jgi:hypothetical protein
MDDKTREWAQRELAKRLGLKKYKKYPAKLLDTLLSNPERREDLERARRDEMEWEGLLPFARLAYQVWETTGPRESFPQGGQIGERAAEQLGDYATERSKLFSEYLVKLAAPEDVIIRESSEGLYRSTPNSKVSG